MMLDPAKIASGIALVDAAPGAASTVLAAGLMREALDQGEAVSVPLFWRSGQWQAGLPLGFQVVAVARSDDVEGGQMLLGLEGQWAVATPTAVIHSGQVDRAALSGPFRRLRSIDGEFYAIGGARDVYQRAGDRWHLLATGLPVFETDTTDADTYIEQMGEQLELWTDMATGGEGRRVAVGTSGEMWDWDGHRWERLPSPTNAMLQGIVSIGPQGECAAYGNDGVVVAGGGHRWGVAGAEGAGMAAFRSGAYFRDTLFLVDGLTVLQGAQPFDRLQQVASLQPYAAGLHAAQADDTQLLLLGQDRVLRSEDGLSFSAIL